MLELQKYQIDLQVPNLTQKNDEQLEAVFPTLDGCWSRSTKAALVKFDTQHLELDANWASVWPSWRCPSCKRSKLELFRLTKQGVLLARLDVHHDHLTDRIAKILKHEFGIKWPQTIPQGTYNLAKCGAQLISRFDQILICVDCNAADGDAKRTLSEIDESFSFRASEICQFVQPKANKSHKLDFVRAHEIYKAEQADFNRRLELAEMFVSLIRSGAIQHEAAPYLAPSPLSIPEYLYRWVLQSDSKACDQIKLDVSTFERRSVARDAVASTIKAKATKI